MAKASYKLPNVFVGCPYGGKFNLDAFRTTLNRLPFGIFFADARLKTKHLLGILETYIAKADFCIFDISTWNPNVALEIGLAQGVEADYYILLNGSLTKGVPSDIQGIQRLQYSDYSSLHSVDGLYPLLVKYLVRDYTHPKKLWEALESDDKRDMKYYLALRILAHFKDHKRLTAGDLSTLTRGTHLRKPDRERVLEVLGDLKLIGAVGSRWGAKLTKSLYKKPIKI